MQAAFTSMNMWSKYLCKKKGGFNQELAANEAYQYKHEVL